jgi:branched-chain amino acid transport system permease protein
MSAEATIPVPPAPPAPQVPSVPPAPAAPPVPAPHAPAPQTEDVEEEVEKRAEVRSLRIGSGGIVREPAVPPLTIPRSRLLALLGLFILALVPVPFGDFWYFVGAFALVYAMIGLSVVVVTGYAGLISLMPYTFAGLGAVTTGLAVSSWGWPFWLAIPLAAVVTIPVSVLVGLSSVRLKGLYLAIATLTFSAALGETFFAWTSVTNGQVGWTIARPQVAGLNFASDGLFYFLCLIVVLLLVMMLESLRSSRLGRAMLAVRDNEREAQALGINVYQTKFAAVVIGGMLAGVGGAFLAELLGTVVATPVFQSPLSDATSIFLVSLVVVGGVDRAWGAFFGAIIIAVQQQVFQGSEFLFPFIGIYSALLLITLLMFRPGGLLQVGKIQLELIRRRPLLGTAMVIGILAVNLVGAYLIVKAG